MLYLRCPTCRTMLADKQLVYEKELEKICSCNKSDAQKEQDKRDLLDRIQVTNICCRMRMIRYTKLVEIIK